MENNNIQMNMLLQPYLVYLESYRKREENFITFLGIILPTVGGIIYVFKNSLHLCLQVISLFLILITLVLFWGIFYGISSSYTQRYLQLELSIIERKLKIPTPKSWNICLWEERKKIPWWEIYLIEWKILQENQKMHVKGIYTVIFSSWILWDIIFVKGKSYKIILSFFIGINIAIWVGFIVSRKYEKKLLEKIKEYKNSVWLNV